VATWQEIGTDNLRAATLLYLNGRYRSSVSRSYYAAFSLLTHTLLQDGASFGDNQEAPSHRSLPKLIKQHLALRNTRESVAITRRLYAARIAADYQRRTTDEATARDVRRDLAQLLRYLGVNDD